MSNAEWLGVVIGLIGGLVFFMFGMNVMSGSLEKMAGGKLEKMLGKVTSNPFISILLGAVITIAVQSSSATTVMLVGLVNSGLMTMSQTLFVIYGANIGTTFTSWILSLSGIEGNIGVLMLQPANFAPVLALVGTAMIMFSHKDNRKSIGTIFIGFAVLIYGMEWMGDAVKPLAALPTFADTLQRFDNPIVCMLIGMVFTGIIQSSAATIGIVQTFAGSGVMNNGMALPLVMGANIGTCVTSLISCIGTNRHAKRVAVLHLTMNVIGTVVWLAVYMLVIALVGDIPFFSDTAYASRFSVAVMHSVFNVLTAALLLPFNKLMERIAILVVRDKDDAVERKGIMLDERLLNSPSVAVNVSNSASVKMGNLAHANVLNALNLITNYDEKLAMQIEENESVLDTDEDKLGTYLVQLSSQALSQSDSQVVHKMLHSIGDFERLGDHALNLVKSAREMRDKNIAFSVEAKAELSVLMEALRDILQLTDKAYTDNDLSVAMRVEPLEQVIDRLITQIRDNHIRRLRGGDCTIELGFILSDLLTNFERISDHCSNIAVAMIEVEHNSFDTHRYLHAVKHGNENFVDAFDSYAHKYSLNG